MAEISYTTKKRSLTKEEKNELKAASKKQILYDEDSPQLSSEQLKEFSRAAKEKKAERKKGVVAIRLDPEVKQQYESLGKGYTGIMANILKNALGDPELIKKSL
jgi:uncharacterized protein (DUF4415 family)